jgi:CheY-like chemotaxis protein
MNEKILFVDDEPAVLAGYKRILRRDFELSTAASGEEALAEIERNNCYAVVVSDMRMPNMNGVQLLSRVREISPQTVRVVLTGYADIECAMNAVNEDAVFRFLTKPCADGILKKTLTSCLLQYRMVTAEKELLENTLMGSIKVLIELLSLANPAAFGRSLRINRYVRHMVGELRLEASWRYEAAAMLSQLGCITLEPEVLEAAYRGDKLTPEDQSHFNLHPAVAHDLLANVPRMEGIAWIISRQFESAHLNTNISGSLETGAAILQIAIAFDQLKAQGRNDLWAIAELGARRDFDAKLVQTLKTLPPLPSGTETREVEITKVEPGMILSEEVRTDSGQLLAGKSQEVSSPLAMRLRSFSRCRAIRDKVAVYGAEDLSSENRLESGVD